MAIDAPSSFATANTNTSSPKPIRPAETRPSVNLTGQGKARTAPVLVDKSPVPSLDRKEVESPDGRVGDGFLKHEGGEAEKTCGNGDMSPWLGMKRA